MNTKHLLLSLLALLGSTTLHAYDAYIGGIYYNLEASTRTATVTYNSSSKYTGSITIPATVTNSGTTYSVKSVGYSAFYGCRGLTSITIPNSVTSIGDYAFESCSGLTSITIPNSVTSIDAYAFTGCSGLTSITIPNSVTSINPNVFSGCSGLTSITIPNSVTSIGAYAFSGCIGLTSITIPESVTSFGNNAFNNCSGLTSITIPTSVTSIGDNAFKGCSDLRSIIIPVSDYASFCNGRTVTQIYVHNSNDITNNLTIKLIDKDGTEIKEYMIPESVTDIDNYAFRGCSGLTSITIPNSVTRIGNSAFYRCSGLTSIIIPNSVTIIENFAFAYCSGLTSVMCLNETPPSLTGTSAFSNRANATLYIPAGSKSAYQLAEYWNEFNEIVEMAPTELDIMIGETGYATYCSNFDLDFSGVSGLRAYIASGFSPSTGKLVLTRVDEVPAGEGLYLVGDEGTYTVPFATTDMLYSNFLKGVTTATTIYPTEGSYTNFILSNGSYGVGFYTLSSSGELAAGKAYLQLPTASVSNVKAISLAFDDDDPTALQEIEDYTTAKDIYNLQGQKVSAPRSGLYIINGKKVAIK